MTCFFLCWFSGISHKQQWWSSEGVRGARALPYFLDQTEAQRVEKSLFETAPPPFLRVWMTKPPVIWRSWSATEQPLKRQHLVIPYGVVVYKRIQLDDLLHHRVTSHHRVHHRVTFFTTGYHWLFWLKSLICKNLSVDLSVTCPAYLPHRLTHNFSWQALASEVD